MSLHLAIILHGSAAWHAERVALREGATTMTYAELGRAARGFAGALRVRGIQPGDHVAVMTPNLRQFAIAYYGILYAGGAVVPLNVLFTGNEVEYHLQDSRAKLLVAQPQFGGPAQDGAKRAGVPVIWATGLRGAGLLGSTGRVASALDNAMCVFNDGAPRGCL